MGKKILLVDDDYDFIVATRTVLEAAGYTVQTAGGGRKAWRRSVPSSPTWSCWTW